MSTSSPSHHFFQKGLFVELLELINEVHDHDKLAVLLLEPLRLRDVRHVHLVPRRRLVLGRLLLRLLLGLLLALTLLLLGLALLLPLRVLFASLRRLVRHRRVVHRHHRAVHLVHPRRLLVLRGQGGAGEAVGQAVVAHKEACDVLEGAGRVDVVGGEGDDAGGLAELRVRLLVAPRKLLRVRLRVLRRVDVVLVSQREVVPGVALLPVTHVLHRGHEPGVDREAGVVRELLAGDDVRGSGRDHLRLAPDSSHGARLRLRKDTGRHAQRGHKEVVLLEHHGGVAQVVDRALDDGAHAVPRVHRVVDVRVQHRNARLGDQPTDVGVVHARGSELDVLPRQALREGERDVVLDSLLQLVVAQRVLVEHEAVHTRLVAAHAQPRAAEQHAAVSAEIRRVLHLLERQSAVKRGKVGGGRAGLEARRGAAVHAGRVGVAAAVVGVGAAHADKRFVRAERVAFGAPEVGLGGAAAHKHRLRVVDEIRVDGLLGVLLRILLFLLRLLLRPLCKGLFLLLAVVRLFLDADLLLKPLALPALLLLLHPRLLLCLLRLLKLPVECVAFAVVLRNVKGVGEVTQALLRQCSLLVVVTLLLPHELLSQNGQLVLDLVLRQLAFLLHLLPLHQDLHLHRTLLLVFQNVLRLLMPDCVGLVVRPGVPHQRSPPAALCQLPSIALDKATGA
eukprot:Rhum_TRINITY_DN14790_c25_g1::Rhum_TRINITY_DN14790_c25_g1_i1::g.118192::m.118192